MSEINCFGDEVIYSEVVPNWWLVQLTNIPPNRNREFLVNGFVMSEGDFGLTYCNDPDFIFSMPPMIDPFTEEDDTEITEEEKLYIQTLDHYTKRLTGQIDVVYSLILSCIEAGYNETDEISLTEWLMNKMHESFKKGIIRTHRLNNDDNS